MSIFEGFLLIFVAQGLAVLGGTFDRLRGDNLDFGSALLEKLAYAGVVLLTIHSTEALLGHETLHPLISWSILLTFVVGISTGWGEPMGAMLERRPQNPTELERWQFGILKTHAGLAMTFRGWMTGAWILPLMYWDYRVVFISLAMMVAMPLAILIARDAADNERDRWEMQEWLRGYLFITLLSFFHILNK